MTDYIYRFFSGVKGYYSSMNAAYLSGAIDVLVVEQEDGSFKSSPFHVRFGKSASFLHDNRHVYVDVYINDTLSDLKMKLGPAGEAFFVEEVEGGKDDGISASRYTSPIQSDDEDEDDTRLPRVRTDSNKGLLSPVQELPETPGTLHRALSWHGLTEMENKDVHISIEHAAERGVGVRFEVGPDTATGAGVVPDFFSPADANKDALLRQLASVGASLSNPDLTAIDNQPEPIDVDWQWGQLPKPMTKETSTDCNSEIVTGTAPAKKVINVLIDSSSSVSSSSQPVVPVSNTLNSASDKPKDPPKGVYLDDLDPELSKLYLYQAEGSPREQSHHTRETNSPVSDDFGYKSDTEVPCGNCGSFSPKSTALSPQIRNLSLSLCGGLKNENNVSWDRFLNHMITFEDFNKDPDGIISNPDLVVRLNDQYYNWKVAGPMVLSVIAFQAALPQKSVEQLERKYMMNKPASGSRKKRGWFLWKSTSAEPEDQNKLSPNTEHEQEPVGTVSGPSVGIIVTPSLSDDQQQQPTVINSDLSSYSDVSDTDAVFNSNLYFKSVRLTTKQIQLMNLKEGPNKIVFSITTSFQGTTQCTAYIYRMKWFDKFVISDIDGTITRSDVLGHILPMIGKTWTHEGVAKFYSKVRNNGYHILYLSSRGIGMAGITRQFLEWVKEDGCLLPDGPIMLNPTSLVTALKKEVIEKCPEKFKIACLSDLKSLFPENPFYAGFGNRENDAVAYEAVGIEASKIYIINHNSEIFHKHSFVQGTSYKDLDSCVDMFFPPLVAKADKGQQTTYHHIDYREYSEFAFWSNSSSSFPLEIPIELTRAIAKRLSGNKGSNGAVNTANKKNSPPVKKL